MIPLFENKRALLASQFEAPNCVADSGLSKAELQPLIEAIESAHPAKAIAKAKSLALIAERAQLAVDAEDIFQDKILAYGLLSAQRKRWEKAVKEAYLAKESAEVRRAWQEFGAYSAIGDYGHTSPNTRLLLSVGFAGLLERVRTAAKKEGLTDRQAEFYTSCEISLGAAITAARRLSAAIAPYNADNARALTAIAEGAPRDSYEAMQLLVLYFFLHEYVGGTRVRTLGRLDVLLDPFFRQDLASGRYTKAELSEMLKFFLHKFWVAKVPFDLPFCLGGTDENGNDVTSEATLMIVDAYDALNIYSPKIHIRICESTPKAFVLRVLDCIRRGNSSFVFVNDRVAIEGLKRVGIDARDAWDFVPIGCYEPAVWGMEIGCTGNGCVSLPKALELVLCNGRDHASGICCGLEAPLPSTFEKLLQAVKAQLAHMTERALDYVVGIEGYYREINPDPLLSCQYEHSVECGVDVYEGGAKYNNSSMYFYSIATLVDALCAVKRFVFDEKRYTLTELSAMLRADWVGHERERLLTLRLPEKYGTGAPLANALAKEIAAFCAGLVNNKPNGRGGVFKAALFTIDNYIHAGKHTMATPDGRHADDPLSKNLCATVGADRGGITALIHSVTAMDLADFPNGSVLDVLLHPSAVAGAEGLEAFYHILMTYFKKGGFAMHGNVFCADELKKAQREPEKYKNLQVRVCGWNAYFVNLSKIEQDCFIKQAEGLL